MGGLIPVDFGIVEIDHTDFLGRIDPEITRVILKMDKETEPSRK